MRINTKGQMLLISVLLLFALLVAVPTMIFLNRQNTSYSVIFRKKSKARLVSEEAVALAVQQMSKMGITINAPTPYWPYLGGTMPAPATMTNMLGTNYQIAYSSVSVGTTDPRLQPYQVGVTARPIDAHGNVVAGSSIFATLSKRTFGAELPTGFTAPAALEISSPPVQGTGATLRVEWGAVVLRDTHTWDLGGYMDLQKRPRKFAAGPITARCASSFCLAGKTDNKEYWSYTYPGITTVVDEAFYVSKAQTLGCTAITMTCSEAATGSCATSAPGKCMYTTNDISTVTLSGTLSMPPGGAIVINGNARFRDLTVDTNMGAIIVNGNLWLDNNNASCSPTSTICPPFGFPPTVVRLPPARAADDPECTCSDMICTGSVDRHIDLRGAIYVRGNVYVEPTYHWTLNGSMRVDGRLYVKDNSSFVILYNDLINHAVATTHLDIQVDSMGTAP